MRLSLKGTEGEIKRSGLNLVRQGHALWSLVDMVIMERNRQDHRNCVISKVASKFLDDDLFRGWKVSEIEVRAAN